MLLHLRHFYTLIILYSITTCSAAAEPLYFTSNMGGNFDIYRCSPQGKGITQLTDTPWDEKDISLSSDKKFLIYISADGYIKIMDIASSSIVDSFDTENIHLDATQPSFYGNSVVFSHLVDIKRDYSVIKQYKNNQLKNLITKQASLFFPVSIPGTKDLLYAYRVCLEHCGTFVNELWHYSAKGNLNRQITLERSFIIDPVCLDSETVYYASNKKGTMDIYRLTLSTGQSSLQLSSSADLVHPAPSQSGEKLAYIRRERGTTTICIHTFSDSATTELTSLKGRHLDLLW